MWLMSDARGASRGQTETNRSACKRHEAPYTVQNPCGSGLSSGADVQLPDLSNEEFDRVGDASNEATERLLKKLFEDDPRFAAIVAPGRREQLREALAFAFEEGVDFWRSFMATKQAAARAHADKLWKAMVES